MQRRKVYLDYNATTPLHPKVQEAMQETIKDYGNPSSLHTFGRKASHYVETSREKVAAFLGAGPKEIIFVGSGTEANNTVLSMLVNRDLDQLPSFDHGRTELVTTRIEHPCVLETSKFLEKRGLKTRYINVDSWGRVDLDQLKDAVSDKTLLVSVMMANNEIGTIQDIKTISGIVHKKGALLHTDAVQAFGKIPIDVNDLNIDYLTLSAHKIYGPKGVGALYVRQGSYFSPFIVGGHQEEQRRGGTLNSLGIIGLGKAVDMRRLEMKEEAIRLRQWKDDIIKGISDRIPDIHFNGHPQNSLVNTINVSFDGTEGESILLHLDLEGIAVSTGSACTAGSLEPSHVLLATGLGLEFAYGTIRISTGRDTTREDIEYFLEVLPHTIKTIRDMSGSFVRE